MSKKISNLVGVFSTSVGLRVIRLIIGLMVSAMMLRHLGQDGFGQVFISLSLIAPFLCLVELGLGRITVRELLRHPDEEGRILGTTLVVRSVAGFVMFLVLMSYALFIDSGHAGILLVYGLLLLTHPSTEFHSTMEARGQMARTSVLQFSAAMLGLSLAAVGVWLKMPVLWFACGYVIECWVASLLVWRTVMKRGIVGKWKWDPVLARKLLKESGFEMAAQLALLLLLRLDGVMIGWMKGDAAAGEYGAATRISEVVYFIAPILAGVALRPLVQLQKSDPVRYEQRFADYLAANLLIGIVCTVALALCAGTAIHILAGSKFPGAMAILTVHAWAVIPYFIGVARTQYLTAESRLRANLSSVALGVIINATLNYFWIPVYGGVGAAWATLIAYVVAWVMTCFIFADLRPVVRLHWVGIKRLPLALKQVMASLTGRQISSTTAA